MAPGTQTAVPHTEPGNRKVLEAVAALGGGPLTGQAVATHLRPLFTRSLAAGDLYLATHSLGRPLDATEADLAEAMALWQRQCVDAWPAWLNEEAQYRAQLGALFNAPRADCVVPRVSAGPALRTVLNMLPIGACVLSTTGEFTSIAMLLAQYAALGRIELFLVTPEVGSDGDRFEAAALCAAVRSAAARGERVSLVVVSHVFFATGQLLAGIDALAAECHAHGARLLVDSYHSLGALPVDVQAMQCDYLIGGCYKYLRGGPGAAFLYLAPQVLDSGLRPLDTGWFALQTEWQTDSGPRLREGGDALLEGTPPVLTYYQARAGLTFSRGVGIDRLRAYSLGQMQNLRGLLAEQGIASHGGDSGHGAFVTVKVGDAAEAVVAELGRERITVNARQGRLRLTPDCLTTEAELGRVAEALGRIKALERI